VDSTPRGALVTINGKTVGLTPVVIRNTPVGTKAVRITADGYAVWSQAVRIVANQRTVTNANLQPVVPRP
jgi:hypothetical protein